MSLKWDLKFVNLALDISKWSKDISTKAGAVIVGKENNILSTGYNGLPRDLVDDIPERLTRPQKYYWHEHAERNAIYNAARHGVKLEDSTIYTNWIPCSDCARAIIQSGIKRIVIPEDGDEPHLGNPMNLQWVEGIKYSLEMLKEVNIKIDKVKNDTVH